MKASMGSSLDCVFGYAQHILFNTCTKRRVRKLSKTSLQSMYKFVYFGYA